MTAQVTAAEAPNGRATGSPYSEKLVGHVTPEVKDRLGMQAALEGCPPAHLLDRILGAGLMTYDQIADATRQRGSGERSNGHGAN
jgi:hypothetical protein